MKTINTRATVKDIKALDKTVNMSRHMKDAYIRTKERAEGTQSQQYDSPSGYAADKVQNTAQGAVQETAHNFPAHRIKTNVDTKSDNGQFRSDHYQITDEINLTGNSYNPYNPAKRAFTEDKGQSRVDITRMDGNTSDNSASTRPSLGISEPGNTAFRPLDNAQIVCDSRPNYMIRRNLANSSDDAVKPVENASRTIKTAQKTVKGTAKGTVKTASRSVNTAEQTTKQAAKAAQKTAKTAQKTAQAAAKSARAAEKAARASAKAAVRTAKAVTKAVISLVKITISAVKGLVAAIAAGGWAAIAIILVICMVAMIIGSVFGIFFSGEPNPETGQTINTVIAEINTEYDAVLNAIISSISYDRLDMSGARALWKHVLAVYTVMVVTDPNNPMEVAMMTAEKAALLRIVFWDINTITGSVDYEEIEEDVLDDDGEPTGETETVTYVVLRITVTRKTVDEMAAHYGFSDAQRACLAELMKSEHNGLWNALLYGISSAGDGSMIEIAETQLGNIGGETYWRWYGFTERVEWCACFVSWCAKQCGYIDSGILPRFSSCRNGVQWFQDRDQWRDPSYTPSPGDIIFFDWEPDGMVDHVGIVERVDDDYVYTIEGNSSDSVRRRSYDLDRYCILGYGIPIYGAAD